jgi:hypothetical protein
MAALVTGPNKFGLLANALAGSAKGAQDFAQLKMKRDAMEEQSRQFDEQLALGVRRLEEQARQFDMDQAQKKEFNDLLVQFREKSLVSEEMRAAEALRSAERRTGMQVAEQRRAREQRAELEERNFGLRNTVEGLIALDVPGMDAMRESNPEAYEASVQEKAVQWAELKAVGGSYTDEDLRIAEQQVRNFGNIKGQYNKYTADIFRAKNAENALTAAGFSSDTGAGLNISSSSTLVPTQPIKTPGDQESRYISVPDPGSFDLAKGYFQSMNPAAVPVIDDLQYLTSEYQDSRKSASERSNIKSSVDRLLRRELTSLTERDRLQVENLVRNSMAVVDASMSGEQYLLQDQSLDQLTASQASDQANLRRVGEGAEAEAFQQGLAQRRAEIEAARRARFEGEAG